MSEATSTSIRKLNGQAKAVLERETRGQVFQVSGLVRSVPHVSRYGHTHFTIEDGNYAIRCFLHQSNRSNIAFTVKKDMELEIIGTLSLYDREARLSLDIEQVTLIQQALFNVNNSEVVEQLRKEGLYPPQKKKVPKEIKKIGLVTSKHSDALHDFEQIYRKHALGNVATVQLVDVHVQGQNAPQEIADAINRLNLESEVDVIIVTRGGGSVRDLSIFNDYLIAAAICRSKIPIVTGIGHHRNQFLADIVADHQAGTPTDAAYFLATGKSDTKSPDTAEKLRWPYVVTAIVVVIVLLVIVFLLRG